MRGRSGSPGSSTNENNDRRIVPEVSPIPEFADRPDSETTIATCSLPKSQISDSCSPSSPLSFAGLPPMMGLPA